MARPMLGDAKRDVVTTMRMTKEESDLLTQTFGKPATGLRALLDAWKATHAAES
jgi:hypothetical protein